MSLSIFPFLFLIFVGLFLPSDGSHGIFHPKSFAFFLACFSFFFSFLSLKTFSKKGFLSLSLYLAFLFFIGIWMLLSFLRKETESISIFDQTKLFFITATTCFFSFFLFAEKKLSFSLFLKTVLYANFGFSFLKTCLVFFHFLGFINIWELMEIMGLRYMSMQIAAGLIRMQTSVDIITPYLLFFAFQAPYLGVKLPKGFIPIYTLISFIAIFLSFSRFLLFVGFISCFLHVFTLPLLKKWQFLCFTIFSMLTFTFLLGVEEVGDALYTRLKSAENQQSDAIRIDQVEALFHEFLQYPLLGKGVGSFASTCIRETEEALYHSYETQSLAFLMQFGLIGFFCLSVFLFLPAIAFFQKMNKQKFAFFLLFVLWIFSGFTNPYLISLTSGIFYGLMAVTSEKLSEAKEKKPRLSFS